MHFCVNCAVPSLKVSSTHPLTRRLTFPFECIGGVVDEAAHDHLYELEGGDQHGHTPRHSQSDSSSDQQPGGRYSPDGLEEVVGVHQRVHEEVHDDEPAGWSRVLAEGVPAVDEDGDVVIPAVSSRHSHLSAPAVYRYQWRNISFCFLSTMKTVSPSSGTCTQLARPAWCFMF